MQYIQKVGVYITIYIVAELGIFPRVSQIILRGNTNKTLFVLL
jgi:hypothetical protein